MDEKITLDLHTLRALGAETRVAILKRLSERRKTQTELAGELGLAVPSVREHLDALEEAQLVKRAEEGRKWKYYELTWKGKQIVEPKELRVWLLLGASSAIALTMGYSVFNALTQPAQAPAPIPAPEAFAAKDLALNAAVAAAPTVEAAAETQCAVQPQLPIAEMALLVAALLVAGACIGYLLKKR